MRGSVILFRGSSSTHHASIHLPRQLFRTKTCGPRHSIWSLLTCSFTHHSYHCYWLCLLMTEMLYMEWTHLFIYSSQLPLLFNWLGLFLWTEMLYMEWTHLFIYSSQLPLLLTWFILVDWDALYGVNPMFIYSSQLPLLFTLLILVDWDALYGVVHLLITATIAIGLAYSCGLRCSIWS